MQQSEAYIIVASLKHPKVTFHVTLSIARLVPGVVMTISILTSSAGERQHQHRQTSLCGQHWALGWAPGLCSHQAAPSRKGLCLWATSLYGRQAGAGFSY